MIVWGERLVATGKTAPDRGTEVAVYAALPLIVAGGHRDDAVVARVSVVLHTFIAVTSREENDTAAPRTSRTYGVVDRLARVRG
jgi:hypothetical protein